MAEFFLEVCGTLSCLESSESLKNPANLLGNSMIVQEDKPIARRPMGCGSFLRTTPLLLRRAAPGISRFSELQNVATERWSEMTSLISGCRNRRFYAVGITIGLLIGCNGGTSDVPPVVDDAESSTSASNTSPPREEPVEAEPTAAPTNPRDAAIDQGLSWLLAQQDEDGGWHSETYGALRGGAATTALVLYAASHLPEEMRLAHAESWNEGAEFLRPGIESEGCVVCLDGTKDYPAYGSAMLIVAARQLPLDLPPECQTQLVDFLAVRQIAESRAFTADNLHYGGWDLMTEFDPPNTTEGSSISLSCYVLEALGPVDTPTAMEACEKARAWIARCAAADGSGGFLFTSDPDSIKNKARLSADEGGQAVAYGTTTVDGMRCLLSLGTTSDDPLLTGSVQWLMEHDRLDGVPGFEDLVTDLDWTNGLLFYYYASLAKSLEAFPVDASAERAAAIQTAVLARQHEDGRWENEATAMRENDPLIATCLAIIALEKSAGGR